MESNELASILTDLGIGQEGVPMVQVFLIVFATLLANYLALRLLTRLQARFALTRNFWDDALVEAARRPLGLLIWLLGISWAAEVVAQHTEAVIFEAVAPLREVGVILLLAWFLVGFIQRVELALVSPARMKQPMDETTARAIGKLLRLSIIITAVLIMLQTLGFSISGVLAFGGIGGIAVGFAAKDLLANFFGGLMIYLDRPFVVGDWIRSPDRQIEGTVEDIGWRLTRIRTFDKRPLYVPNATFASIAVENPSRMTNRRIYETIGLRYEDAGKLAAVLADVKQMLEQHEAIDTGQTLMVNFNSYGPSSLDFFIYAFTKTTNWVKFHEIKQDVLLRIIAIIHAHEADVAFPTRTLHLADPVRLAANASVEASAMSEEPPAVSHQARARRG